MEEAGDPHFKRERSAAYGQHPTLHMSPTEATHLHNYHHPTQGAQMPPSWNPAPSPYHDGHDHRPLPPDGPPPHGPPPSYPPPQNYPHPPPPSQTPTYHPDAGYSRHNSTSASTRSPPSAQPPHYPPPPPVNGVPPAESYYSENYRNRPPYPPESPASAPQQPALHVQTANHEMMPGQPPPGYPPPPHSAGPPATPGYWPPPPADWYQNQQRRKPIRAAQACDSCRQRKAKCDEGRPECTHCKENALRCSYRDVPPQKSEKQMMQMGEKVDALAEKLDSHVKSTDDKLTSLLNTVQSLVGSQIMESKTNSGVPMTKSRSRPQTKEEPQSSSSTQFTGHQHINAPFMSGFDNATDNTAPPLERSDVGKKTRGPMGASDLLMWPSIRELVPKDIPVSYVMDSEVERGLLRLYGCGEGEDKNDGHDGVGSPAASHSSGRMEDDGSNSSPLGVWGTGQLPHREGNNNPVYDHPGGVTPNGELLLDRKAVDMYVKSYLDRMHILHPFLDPRVLRKMVHIFKRKHSWDWTGTSARLTQSVAAGSKRKREMSGSPSSMTEDLPPHSVPHHNGVRNPLRNTQPIEHSVSNAIILLVIALGKICMYDKPLPGPPKSSSVLLNAKIPTPQQPLLGYGDLPPLPPPSSAPTSPYPAPHTNGLSSIPTSASNLHGKNMDVIPGLAYYAKAADILGELPGGVDVSHIQANLLAGLYMGQLARIIPSHWYIANACRACQILIRSADYKENKMPAERRNLINFAFWSCLQLESDILAEMDIPSSGIIHKEASMLLEIPTALTIADPEKEQEEPSRNPQEFLRHYSNQIQLRRTLNDAMHNIYDAEREQNKPTRLIETIGENLENWRHLLQDWDWDEDDHESGDINHARMRGKYYGAKYIINRPALHYALSLSSPGTPMSRPSESPLAAGSLSEHTSPAMMHHGSHVPNRRVTDMRPPVRAPEPLEEWILEACRRCIEAAIRSTTAFDKVPPRLVITNILGTAHAQFGNILVLSAAFSSPNLHIRSMVPEGTLRRLLKRTISFLEDKAGISPALGSDARILRYLQNKIFPSNASMAPVAVSANSSFSSNR